MTAKPAIAHRRSGLIEILVLPHNHDTELGYRLFGQQGGGSYLIAGAGAIVDQVFEHLLAMPDIGALRGQLCLLKIEALDHVDAALPVLNRTTRFEDFMFLPFAPGAAVPQELERAACWSAIRFCLRHGLLPERATTPQGRRLH